MHDSLHTMAGDFSHGPPLPLTVFIPLDVFVYLT